MAAAPARAHAPVQSITKAFAPPMLGPRKRAVYVRVSSHDARHLTFCVDRMYRHARLCKDLRVHHPVPLPRQYKKWTILSGPFIDKKSREQYEIRTHTRLMVIEGDDRNTSKYIEFLKNEEVVAGINVKVQEKAFYSMEDFFEPFDDPELAIEREVLAEVKRWRKESAAKASAEEDLESAALEVTQQPITGEALRRFLREQCAEPVDDPSDEELGLPENATKRLDSKE